MARTIARRICGRDFTENELAIIQEEIEKADPPLRAEIARRVCQALNWKDIQGKTKEMSCRVALLRLHRCGTIQLPPPRNGNGNGKGLSRQSSELPKQIPIHKAVHELQNIELQRVDNKKKSALWNGLIEKYHYLGYQPLPGAQLRYLIRSNEGCLGAIGFGAAAWKVKSRDEWIGWDRSSREANLGKVLNNARFLILPWVESSNLASKVLSLCRQTVPIDFERRYGIRPVLFETFVESRRFRGTCYRAANWFYLGQTQGRGKCDREHRHLLPVKEVYVYPLVRQFRRALGAGS